MAIKVQDTIVIGNDRSVNNAVTVYQESIAGAVFWGNANTIAVNTTLGNTHNHMSIGPLTINNGVTVTVSAGTEWVVV